MKSGKRKEKDMILCAVDGNKIRRFEEVIAQLIKKGPHKCLYGKDIINNTFCPR